MAENRVNWQLFDSFEKQSTQLAKQVSQDIVRLLKLKERVVISVPGGNTPHLFLKELSRIPLEWSRVAVVLNDERWVPLTSDQSNEAMLKRTLQSHEAKKINVIPFYRPDMPADEAIDWFNIHYHENVFLDICVLGMGEDGHTASLFPGMKNLTSALDNTQPPQLILSVVPEKELRVSLNLSSLLTAEKHYLLIKGHAKKNILEDASRNSQPKWPISYLTAKTVLNIYYSDDC